MNADDADKNENSADYLKQLEEARAIGDATIRAQTLADLPPHLTSDLQPQVIQEILKTTEMISDIRTRADIITKILPYVSVRNLDEALEHVLTIEDIKVRTTALVSFLPHLPADKRATIVTQMYRDVEIIDDIDTRAQILANLLPHMVDRDPVLKELLKIAPSLKENWARSATFVSLSRQLAEDGQIDEALRMAQQVPYDGAKAKALSNLLSHTSDETQKEAIANQAVAAARNIQTREGRAGILKEITPDLSEPLQAEVLAEVEQLEQAESVPQPNAPPQPPPETKTVYRDLEGSIGPKGNVEMRRIPAQPEQREAQHVVQTVLSEPQSIPVQPEQGDVQPDIGKRYAITTHALSDQPTVNDLLGFTDYAEALVKFIEDPNTDKPLTIAIDAPWGMGKSSLMRMIEQRLTGKDKDKQDGPETIWLWRVLLWPWRIALWLWRNIVQPIWRWIRGQPKEARFPTVWFNAWQYDQSEAIWANLVLEILAQTQTRLNPIRRFLMKLKLNSKRFDLASLLQRALQWLLIYGLIVGMLGLVVTVWALLFTSDTLAGVWQQTRQYLDQIGLGAFILAIVAVGKEVYDKLTQPLNLKLEEYFRRPDYAEKAGFLNQFQADFKRVIEVVTEKGRWPLVIFIDDLDRCEPPKPVEIVEAINLLLDSKHCVFILGMDTRTVAGSIEAKYKDMLQYLGQGDGSSALTFGQQFLEKIVQIRFRIPPTNADKFQTFITEQLRAKEKKVAPPKEKSDFEQHVDQAVAQIKAEQRHSGQAAEAAAAKLQAGASLKVSPKVIQAAQEQVQADEALFDQSEDVQATIVAAASYLGYSPRQVKRFINLYRLQAFIAQQRDLLRRDDFQLGLLGKWLILNTGWPRVATQVRRDKGFIDRFDKAADLKQRLKEHWDKPDAEKDETYKELQADLEARLEDPLLAEFVTDNHLRQLLAELKETETVRLYLDLTEISADPTESA